MLFFSAHLAVDVLLDAIMEQLTSQPHNLLVDMEALNTVAPFYSAVSRDKPADEQELQRLYDEFNGYEYGYAAFIDEKDIAGKFYSAQLNASLRTRRSSEELKNMLAKPALFQGSAICVKQPVRARVDPLQSTAAVQKLYT